MARKIKEAKTQGSNGQGAPVDAEGFYFLPRPLLMEYRAADSEFRHVALSLRVTMQELGALLSKVPEIAQKLAEKDALIQESKNKQQALVAVHQQIEQVYGIKMQEIAIDDITGRMQRVVEGKPQFEGDEPAMLKPVTTPPKIKRVARSRAAL
jgi:hypothetical protein